MTMNERIEFGFLFSDNCGHEYYAELKESIDERDLKKVSNAEKNQLTYFDGWHALSIVTKYISIDPYEIASDLDQQDEIRKETV